MNIYMLNYHRSFFFKSFKVMQKVVEVLDFLALKFKNWKINGTEILT